MMSHVANETPLTLPRSGFVQCSLCEAMFDIRSQQEVPSTAYPLSKGAPATTARQSRSPDVRVHIAAYPDGSRTPMSAEADGFGTAPARGVADIDGR